MKNPNQSLRRIWRMARRIFAYSFFWVFFLSFRSLAVHTVIWEQIKITYDANKAHIIMQGIGPDHFSYERKGCKVPDTYHWAESAHDHFRIFDVDWTPGELIQWSEHQASFRDKFAKKNYDYENVAEALTEQEDDNNRALLLLTVMENAGENKLSYDNFHEICNKFEVPQYAAMLLLKQANIDPNQMGGMISEMAEMKFDYRILEEILEVAEKNGVDFLAKLKLFWLLPEKQKDDFFEIVNVPDLSLIGLVKDIKSCSDKLDAIEKIAKKQTVDAYIALALVGLIKDSYSKAKAIKFLKESLKILPNEELNPIINQLSGSDKKEARALFFPPLVISGATANTHTVPPIEATSSGKRDAVVAIHTSAGEGISVDTISATTYGNGVACISICPGEQKNSGPICVVHDDFTALKDKLRNQSWDYGRNQALKSATFKNLSATQLKELFALYLGDDGKLQALKIIWPKLIHANKQDLKHNHGVFINTFMNAKKKETAIQIVWNN